jgi:hypothetical protein
MLHPPHAAAELDKLALLALIEFRKNPINEANQ